MQPDIDMGLNALKHGCPEAPNFHEVLHLNFLQNTTLFGTKGAMRKNLLQMQQYEKWFLDE